MAKAAAEAAAGSATASVAGAAASARRLQDFQFSGSQQGSKHFQYGFGFAAGSGFQMDFRHPQQAVQQMAALADALDTVKRDVPLGAVQHTFAHQQRRVNSTHK